MTAFVWVILFGNLHIQEQNECQTSLKPLHYRNALQSIQESSSLRSFSLLSFIKINVKDMAALGIFKNKADWKRWGEEHAFIVPFLQLLFRFY